MLSFFLRCSYRTILLFGLVIAYPCLSQHLEEETDHQEEAEHHSFKHHKLALIISHTHVPKGIHSADNQSTLIIPSWGFNYEYWFNPKWALGLHNDMEISTYIIDEGESSELERERPLIISLVGIYKPIHHLILLVGGGREFENNENFWIIRMGIEYEFELNNHWDLAPSLVFDLKEDVYDSWTLGITVGKRFGK